VTPTSRGSETPLWDWLGEALAVDFANTTRRYGDEERDLLEVPDDLVLWAELQRGRTRMDQKGEQFVPRVLVRQNPGPSRYPPSCG